MNNTINSFETAKDLVVRAKKQIEEISVEGRLSGLETGFVKLDRVTSGFQPSDLIIIAGRPSMGKSAFVLSIARNMAVDFGIPVAFFSPEMSSLQLINRLISFETGLSLKKIRTGTLEPHEWTLLSINTKKIEKAPIYFDDSPYLMVQNLCDRARNLVENDGVRVIIIDNIHLVSAGNKGNGDITREHEISIVVRALKDLAKELNIPILIVSQLSRELESRGVGKRPILSDLRGSGTLEDIADIVSFVYRPEYYKIDEWDDDDAFPTADQAEIMILKHRNGGIDNVRMKFLSHIGKFDNLDDYDGGSDNDLPTAMNNDDNPFSKKSQSPHEAFGSNLNDDDDDDMPF